MRLVMTYVHFGPTETHTVDRPFEYETVETAARDFMKAAGQALQSENEWFVWSGGTFSTGDFFGGGLPKGNYFPPHIRTLDEWFNSGSGGLLAGKKSLPR